MRQVQKQILADVAQKLSVHAVPTSVSESGLAYFTSTDKQTSIALQVDLVHIILAACLVFCVACNKTSIKAMMAASLQVGEAEKLEWLVASCTALVGSDAFSCLSSCRGIPAMGHPDHGSLHA